MQQNIVENTAVAHSIWFRGNNHRLVSVPQETSQIDAGTLKTMYLKTSRLISHLKRGVLSHQIVNDRHAPP